MDDAPRLVFTVGIPAYNEEKNIGLLLERLEEQRLETVALGEVIVIASGCTDRTAEIANAWRDRMPYLRVVVESERSGKASAVNTILRLARYDILVILNADTLPERTALQNLVEVFRDPTVGMAGGRPIPGNAPSTFFGFTVHLLWELHDLIARRNPKLGELVAVRKAVEEICPGTAVDEATLEAMVRAKGLQLRYVPEAIVFNMGPQTLRDFLRQRRRIAGGHYRLASRAGYRVSTLSPWLAFRLLFRCTTVRSWRAPIFLPGAVALELLARALGYIDGLSGRESNVWVRIGTTKEPDHGAPEH